MQNDCKILTNKEMEKRIQEAMKNAGIPDDITEWVNPELLDDTNGRKFDAGKLQYGLLPPEALRQTVEVLTYGATKYAPDNWRYVPEAKRRYFDAAQRHIWAWKAGEENDSETGASHLAHAICCLMFLLETKE